MSIFTDVQFMTAKEKELVFKSWQRFLKALSTDWRNAFNAFSKRFGFRFCVVANQTISNLSFNCRNAGQCNSRAAIPQPITPSFTGFINHPLIFFLTFFLASELEYNKNVTTFK